MKNKKPRCFHVIAARAVEMQRTTLQLRSLPSSFRIQDVYARTAEMWRCGAATHTCTQIHAHRHTHAHRCSLIKIPSQVCWEALGRSLGRELMHCNKPQPTKPCRTTTQWQGHCECQETKGKTGSLSSHTAARWAWGEIFKAKLKKKKK